MILLVIQVQIDTLSADEQLEVDNAELLEREMFENI